MYNNRPTASSPDHSSLDLTHQPAEPHVPSPRVAPPAGAHLNRVVHHSFATHDLEFHTEASSWEGSRLAQQIQATHYLREGWVSAEALDEEGCLQAQYDGSRGPTVEYWIARRRNRPGMATSRMVGLDDRGLHSMPSYRNAADGFLAPWADELLVSTLAEHGPTSVWENSAMGFTDDGTGLGILEIIRALVQRVVLSGQQQVWLGTLVATTLESMLFSYGPACIQPAGEPIRLHERGHSPISPDLLIVPVIIEPLKAYSQLLQGAHTADDQATRDRRLQTLLFMTDGLHPEELSPDVAQFLADLGSLADQSAS